MAMWERPVGVGPADPDAVAGGVGLNDAPELRRGADAGRADPGDRVADTDSGCRGRRTGVDGGDAGAGVAQPETEERGRAVLVPGVRVPFSRSSAMLTTCAIGIAYPTTSLVPDVAAVVMPTTSPSSSYVAPPESPDITSLLTLIRPRSFSPGLSGLAPRGDALVLGHDLPGGRRERRGVAAGVAHRGDRVSDRRVVGVGR